jgi:hypothetical protein
MGPWQKGGSPAPSSPSRAPFLQTPNPFLKARSRVSGCSQQAKDKEVEAHGTSYLFPAFQKYAFTG